VRHRHNRLPLIGAKIEFSFFLRSPGIRVFAAIMTVVIISLGVLGNSLTVAALIKCPKIRNITAAFIIR
jgi:hypothetical protein